MDTLAFVEAETIRNFVARHSTPMQIEMWRWVTSPFSDFEHLVTYVEERPVQEAPDLDENRYIRSYAGDEYGRGAVIYDCLSDMAWPYHMRHDWDGIGEEVTQIRKHLLDSSYVCTPPKDTDVCVVHLATAFPYDILAEVYELKRSQLELTWREVYEFECRHGDEHRLDHDGLARLTASCSRCSRRGRSVGSVVDACATRG